MRRSPARSRADSAGASIAGWLRVATASQSTSILMMFFSSRPLRAGNCRRERWTPLSFHLCEQLLFPSLFRRFPLLLALFLESYRIPQPARTHSKQHARSTVNSRRTEVEENRAHLNTPSVSSTSKV